MLCGGDGDVVKLILLGKRSGGAERERQTNERGRLGESAAFCGSDYSGLGLADLSALRRRACGTVSTDVDVLAFDRRACILV